jgi:hypothetical protein
MNVIMICKLFSVSVRDNFLLPGSGGTQYVPIVPRDLPVTTAASVIKPRRVGAVLHQQKGRFTGTDYHIQKSSLSLSI